MKDTFTAKEASFQGELGYVVCQYHNEKKVAEQFIPYESYKQFCEAAGIKPEMIK